ncbi:general stress protein [Mammaliicoccus lentus]|uniref:general stress protein n=1 Tax=Mammaliicoccus lentus TaxID=42858 RepID=UPI0027EE8FCA|nr:general stress protein [Mammaliicoccus lentus]MDQ7142644.1 general stress protein [Mammaliicoccus lentus]
MTVVKTYNNDEALQNDINKLKDVNIDPSNVFVLLHDDDRTARIVEHTDYSGIDYNNKDLGQKFDKQGDELKAKLQELGLSKEQAEENEEKMDEGKVFLIVKDDKAKEVLG